MEHTHTQTQTQTHTHTHTHTVSLKNKKTLKKRFGLFCIRHHQFGCSNCDNFIVQWYYLCPAIEFVTLLNARHKELIFWFDLKKV